MVVRLAVLLPRREVSQLAVVAVVCKPHLWTDEKDLLVVADDAAVVGDGLVRHRPSES